MTTYTDEVNVYNPDAIKGGIEGARDAYKAVVSEVGATGVMIHPSGQSGSGIVDYTLIDDEGMEVFDGGTSVAKFGSTARIGDKSSKHVDVTSGGMEFRNGSNKFTEITSISGGVYPPSWKVQYNAGYLGYTDDDTTSDAMAFDVLYRLVRDTTSGVVGLYADTDGSTLRMAFDMADLIQAFSDNGYSWDTYKNTRDGAVMVRFMGVGGSGLGTTAVYPFVTISLESESTWFWIPFEKTRYENLDPDDMLTTAEIKSNLYVDGDLSVNDISSGGDVSAGGSVAAKRIVSEVVLSLTDVNATSDVNAWYVNSNGLGLERASTGVYDMSTGVRSHIDSSGNRMCLHVDPTELRLHYQNQDGGINKPSILTVDQDGNVTTLGAVNDSGWITPKLDSPFVKYSDARTPRYRKLNGMVEIRGGVKPTSTTALNETVHTLFTLPEGYCPANCEVTSLCQGSDRKIWLLTVNLDGTVTATRLRDMGATTYQNATTTEWMMFDVVFTAGGENVS